MFSVASVDRENSEDHSDIYFMLHIFKEKVFSTCGRGRHVLRHELM